MRRQRTASRPARRGQSTLEYILVLAAILVAVIAAATGVMKPAAEQAIQDSGNAITSATGQLKAKLNLN